MKCRKIQCTAPGQAMNKCKAKFQLPICELQIQFYFVSMLTPFSHTIHAENAVK